MQLISSLIHLAVRTDDVNKYLNDIPPLRCEMECSDIGGARHSINIDLRLTLSIINGEDDERMISFSGSIDASRKIYLSGHRRFTPRAALFGRHHRSALRL